MWSKQAICAYVARSAMGFLKQGIRINAICPGPTDTPLRPGQRRHVARVRSDYRDEVGIEASTPLEQAYALVFLCSDAVGDHRPDDHHRCGLLRSGVTGSFPAATPALKFLLGHV